ncbi:hypothetical protein GQX73_g855 [Xylaria multiplex]|uniref:Uncharacterized protein n=1 Tax=Xylaria multiplex TaxID=323545 RepID=A0A7C8IWV6_9PEZI|nr:hypothetical protein GQX73_g855 [Xylaria multiplex]
MIFKKNEFAVAKFAMENTIGPACSKLAVMAEVSEHINVEHRGLVRQFINTYTHDEARPQLFYTIRLASAAQNLDKIIRNLVNKVETCPGFEYERIGSKYLSPTELRRLRRILYICQIAGNLFYWNREETARSYSEPPFPELSRAFWKKVPEWDVIRLNLLILNDDFWINLIREIRTTSWIPRLPNFAIFACYTCSGLLALPRALRGRAYLNAGLKFWDIEGAARLTRIWIHIKQLAASNCNQITHDFPLPMASVVFHHANHATIQEPLRRTNPFYEPDPGIQQRFYNMLCRRPLMIAMQEFVYLYGINPRFLSRNPWVFAIMDNARLPREPSDEELETKRRFWNRNN